MSRRILTVILAGTLLSFLGCSSTPRRPKPVELTLVIQAAGRASSLTIPVYIAAANQFYEKSLLEEPVDQILERFRANPSIDIKTFQMSSGGTNISRADPIWTSWLGRHRDHVVIIADLPKNFGGEAHRRLPIPLDKRLWRQLPSRRTVHIEISETAVTLLDSPAL